MPHSDSCQSSIMRRCCGFLCKISFFLTVLILLAAAGALGWVWWLVVKVPCPETAPERIASILGKESQIYYRDGQEKIGVLFEDIHRQYVTYEQLPKHFINALVAAEDDQFFRHYGIDLPGITKAVLINFQAGRIVRGGSTITQQTAKNLFKRPDRTYKAKLKEMLYALRLEHRYSKEKILEFYSNQFYVNGNGHGLGVAARYYFDKDPDGLSLLESAFIAGSVKRPNYYNPFTKQDKQAGLEARRSARERADYVLGRMLKLGMISREEHDAASKGEIPFKRGRTSFDLSTVMDMIQDGLAAKAMTELLAGHGIDNVATAGVRIISTVDRFLQEETLYSLRRELSRLDVQLRGYGREEVQQECREAAKSGEEAELREKDFVFGTIKEINLSVPDQPALSVDLGGKRPVGRIDRQGLTYLLEALVRHRRQSAQAKPGKKDMEELLSRFKAGDCVHVSVRELDPFEGAALLELERWPKLQGAAVALEQGAVRAVAGGMENRFFNRAADGRRLMGSTMKPFLYAAAFQLGWSSLDHLDNRRNVFIFRGQSYFPRPDHKPESSHTSINWAGVKSENVASVWLLYHLTDKLTPAGLLETAAAVDMIPRTDESYEQFSARMRGQFGLNVTPEELDRAAYEEAVRRAGEVFLFEGRASELRRWQELPHGLHFDKFRAQIQSSLKDPKLDKEERAEYKKQIAILGMNYLGLRRTRQHLERYRRYLEQMPAPAVQVPNFFGQSWTEPEAEDESRPPGRLALNKQGRLVFTLRGSLPESWTSADAAELRRRLAFMHPAERETLWDNILLEGAVSAGGADIIGRLAEEERSAMAALPPYSADVLVRFRDYRIMLGLQYLIRLAREAGVGSRLEPVLSFPLGSNVISLLESTRIYETLVTGRRWSAQLADHAMLDETDEERRRLNGLALIERIERPDGTVLYARQAAATPVLDQKSSSEIVSILENVVRWGTGRQAWEQVRLPILSQEKEKGPALPLMGKTGTSNDFRNAAFIGFVPSAPDIDGAALLSSAGTAVGVYVGFDSNEPMKHGSFRVSGSQGALPTWSKIAGALLRLEGAADRLAPEAVAADRINLRYPESGQIFMPVDEKGGGRMRRGKDGIKTDLSPDEAAVLSHGLPGEYGGFEPERRFLPFWLNQNRKAAQPAAAEPAVAE